jgi:methionine salvage enolase-phosphatase E1
MQLTTLFANKKIRKHGLVIIWTLLAIDATIMGVTFVIDIMFPIINNDLGTNLRQE